MGYTDNRDEAGVYTTEEASQILAQASLGGPYDMVEGSIIPNEVMVLTTCGKRNKEQPEAYTRGDNN